MIFRTLDLTLRPVFRFVEVLVVLLGMAMVASVFIQVVLRYGANFSFLGSEELTRFMLTWFIFLSAAVGLDRNLHFEVDTFIRKFPPLARRLSLWLGQLIVLSVLFVFLIKGIELTQRNWRQLSSAMQVPMSFANAAIPVAALLMIGVILREVFRPAERSITHPPT
jgi:TRAP-type C4-dicarboxylate transport system permease small subunit